MRSTKQKPNALMLFPSSHVPEDLQRRLNRLVAPTWHPKGLTDWAGKSTNGDSFEILATGVGNLPTYALAKIPNLQLILTTATSFDFVDQEYCLRNNIMVCNTPSYTGAAVAEHAFALLLDQARHIRALDSAMRRGIDDTERFLGLELEGKTVGIVGLGDIGGRLARLANGFGMDVIYMSRREKNIQSARRVHLNDLLRNSDVIFLTLPLTPKTKNIIGAQAFDVMKSNCILVNVSAEGLVDMEQLTKALDSRKIRGAAIDIPISVGSGYRTIDELTMTPGHGWYTAEGIYRRAATWIETLANYLEGHPKNITGFGASSAEA